MSADVEKAFSVRESFWWAGGSEDHGQGTVLGDHPTWEQARPLAGLDWDPEEEDLFGPVDPAVIKAAYTKIMFDAELSDAQRLDQLVSLAVSSQPKVDGWKRIKRSDIDTTLACKLSSYEVITNSAFGEIFESVLGQDNVKFETGGCLEGGRKVWMLAQLDEPLTIAGDKTLTMPYLALMARHDGEGAVTLRPTNVRIVCKNTFNLAEMGEGGYTVRGKNNGQFNFVHRGDWRNRIDEATAAIGLARQHARDYQAWAANMLTVRVTPETEAKFVATFLGAPPAGLATERVLANVEASRDKLRAILASPTVEGAGIRGTGYGLVQAAGEYLDHAREARSWETKMNRTLLRPETIKAHAVKIVREITADAPAIPARPRRQAKVPAAA